MKVFITFLAFIFSLMIFTQGVEAKVLPQAKKAATKVTSVKTGSTINISPKLRGDKKAIIISFSNLQNASYVSYLLNYKQAGQAEGAMGSLNLTGSSSQSSELLFVTCSKNVCRYHYGITNARLEVSYTLKNGKKYLKKYRIKI